MGLESRHRDVFYVVGRNISDDELVPESGTLDTMSDSAGRIADTETV